jgi:hypothetical protein
MYGCITASKGYSPSPSPDGTQWHQTCMICAVLLVIILFLDKLGLIAKQLLSLLI